MVAIAFAIVTKASIYKNREVDFYNITCDWSKNILEEIFLPPTEI